jgi:7-keto-8-aminopelargonate synthetase-like enzyme
LRAKLWNNLAHFKPTATSAIVPLVVGENEASLAAAQALFEAGFLAPAIRFPTVPRGTARLRITISAAHEISHVSELLRQLRTQGL